MSPSRAAPRQWARELSLPPRPAVSSYKNSSRLPELPAPQPWPAHCPAGPQPRAARPASGSRFGVPALQALRCWAARNSERSGRGQRPPNGCGAPGNGVRVSRWGMRTMGSGAQTLRRRERRALASVNHQPAPRARPCTQPGRVPTQTPFALSWALAFRDGLARFPAELQEAPQGHRHTGGLGLCPGCPEGPAFPAWW